MLTFYAVSIAALGSGMFFHLLGASQEWFKHQQTIKAYNELLEYTKDLASENSILRTVSDESALGSGYPSAARRSHLNLVK